MRSTSGLVVRKSVLCVCGRCCPHCGLELPETAVGGSSYHALLQSIACALLDRTSTLKKKRRELKKKERDTALKSKSQLEIHLD